MAFSTFLTLLWTEKLVFIPGLEFRLVYLLVLGDVMLILGIVMLVLSVQWFYLLGRVVWYRCPFCNKDWRSSGDKALVHCPHCRQLVHPIIIEKPVQ
jgi:tRNA(Ile2) C34 agmatinyltransferase TiaS